MEYEKGDIKYFFKMFKFVKPYAFPFFLGKFFHASQGFAAPFIMSVVTSSFMYAIVNESVDHIYRSIFIFAMMLVGFLIPFAITVYAGFIAEVKIVRDLKKELFRRFINNSLEDATAGHSSEGISSINMDADTAAQVYAWPLSAFLMNVLNIVLSSAVVFVIDWRIGLSAVLIGLGGFFVQHRYTEPLADINRKRLDKWASIVKSTSNIFQGALTIRTFKAEERAIKNFNSENDVMRRLTIKEAFIDTWQNMFSSAQEWITLVAVFALGGWLVATGRLEFHLLLMAPLMCVTISSSFGMIGRNYANLQAAIAGAKRVFRVLDKDCVQRTGTEKKTKGYHISIKDLDFTYADAGSPALNKVNIEIPENKMIAFVGESGSGKSTLLRTVIGLYERDDLGMSLGEVYFNETSTRGWRSNFAYVDQSCKLFDMTIGKNISLGVGGKASEEEIKEAAVQAAAHEFIEELPDKYDTSCGEKGSSLSGGQKQRIAIARALVKKAPVLVFDEATSALDAESERYIMETINSLRENHTILITTHNLENITNADVIVVMDKGNIAEMGNHEELLKLDGLYSKLIKTSNERN